MRGVLELHLATWRGSPVLDLGYTSQETSWLSGISGSLVGQPGYYYNNGSTFDPAIASVYPQDGRWHVNVSSGIGSGVQARVVCINMPYPGHDHEFTWSDNLTLQGIDAPPNRHCFLRKVCDAMRRSALHRLRQQRHAATRRTSWVARSRSVVARSSHTPHDGCNIASVDRRAPSSHDAASPMALELAVVIGDTITVAPLPAHGTVTLGRGEECEVRIDNRSVSRRHAVLHLGTPLRIQDLGSANGTFVRDARSPTDTASTQPLRKLSREAIEIAIGERVNLGSIPIVVRRASVRRGPASPPAEGAVVRDPAMRALYEQVTRAARSSISVLVLGETGVGKEVLARAVHDRSTRAHRPYLELNCAALPLSLLEGELFGHEKHAFTGANQASPGLLESADGGTIFLDEVGELPAPVQIKLLRVLEDRKVLRIGGRTARKLDVRFVAATNRDLEAEVARGSFRQDLYFRLNGVSFVIPPLRARVAEIAPLAERFLAAVGQTLDRTEPLRFSSEALGYLERHAWPGNVRELRNVIERAAVLATGDVIMPADLSGQVTSVAMGPVRAAAPAPAASTVLGKRPAEEQTAERQRIIEALDRCAGNQTRAAKMLGISLRTLVNRLAHHGIPRPRKRS